MMKHEYKKHEKNIYVPTSEPTITDIPAYQYLTITGLGNPNSEEFRAKISALYSLSYAIKMSPKNGHLISGYYEYTVYPLEGIWDLTEEGKAKNLLDKNELVYKIMIRQPDFVTEDVFKNILQKLVEKKNIPFLSDIKFEVIQDGNSIQIMHIGSFDDEPKSFLKMKDYLEKHNLKQRSLVHREIYLSNFQKTKPEDLKTVLRYFIE
ncbi:MAG: GyrI-like domain-containing protein [Acholeplasmataceae bacterium]|nr:GyrI-like domain-containing protein [Acholeplasmataceae bacterium]